MKNIKRLSVVFLLTFFTWVSGFAQIETTISAPNQAVKADSILAVTSAKKAKHIPLSLIRSWILTEGTLSDLGDVPDEPTAGSATHVLRWDDNTDTFAWYDDSAYGGGASSWLSLTDTDPTNYVGSAGYLVRVNATPDGLEFVDGTTLFGDAYLANTQTFTGLNTFNDSGAGGFSNYDIQIGDTDGTPTYGIARFGNSVIGRTSNVTGYNLNGAFVIQNIGGPVTGDIEFAVIDSSNLIRFATPKSGVGNATYNPRSMIIAGPAVADSDIVTLGYWQGQGIFGNLTMDTGTNGADLGVQNDLEVEGVIYADQIDESTAAAGVTIDGVLIKDNLIGANYITGTTTQFNTALSDADFLFDTATLSDLSDVPAEPTGGSSNYVLRWSDTGDTFAWYSDAGYGGGGGTIGGSIADNQVAVGSSVANEIEGSSNLTYNGGLFTVGGNGTLTSSQRLYGGSSTSGGTLRFYNGATVDTENDYFVIGANTTGDFTMDGSLTGSFLKFDSGTTAIEMPEGSLNVGVNNVTRGSSYLFGNNTTTGGALRIYNGANVDTENDYFYLLGTTTGDFEMAGATTGAFLQYDSGNQQLVFPDYGGAGLTGTATKWLAVDTNGNVIQEDPPSVSPAGANTQIQYNSSGSFGADASFTRATNSIDIGQDDNGFGWIKLYGDAISSGSATLDFYNNASQDTNLNAWRLGTKTTDEDFFIYTSGADNVMQFDVTTLGITAPNMSNADITTLGNQALITKAYGDANYGGGGGIGGSIADNQVAVGAATADDIEGSSSLTFNANQLTVGVQDTSQGFLSITGDNGANGGVLRLYNGATGDTDEEYYDIDTSAGVLRILEAGGTNGHIEVSSLTNTVSFPLGSVNHGQSDAIAGGLSLYGGAVANGGNIYFYNAADSDTNDDYYVADANSGLFRIRGATTGNFFEFNSSDSYITLPDYSVAKSGTLAYTLGVDSTGKVITTTGGSGDVTKVGTPVNDEIGTWTGDGTIEGQPEFKYDDANTRLTLGVDDVADGQFYMYGNSTLGSAEIRMYNGATVDTETDYYRHYMTGGDYLFASAGQGTLMRFDAGTDHIEFGQYGSGNITGTKAYDLAVTSGGVIVEEEPMVQTAYKGTDQSRSSTTTETLDSALQIGGITAGQAYAFEIFVYFEAGGTLPDLSVYPGYSGTENEIQWTTQYDNDQLLVTASETGRTFQASVSPKGAYIKGSFEANSGGGTFGLYWAQDVSDATSTTVKAGSYLTLTKLD